MLKKLINKIKNSRRAVPNDWIVKTYSSKRFLTSNINPPVENNQRRFATISQIDYELILTA